MRLLVVEDDPVLNQNLSEILRRSSFAVDSVDTLALATQKASDNEYDLIILDWLLPDGEGTELCRQMRADKNSTPILLLTAKSLISDKIAGLDAGADDYLAKPFDSGELLARIRALLRRHPEVQSSIIKIQDLEINTNLHQVKRKGKVIELSPKEYALLEYLAVNAGNALDRVDILSHVWDENADMFSNTVDVHIRYLRQKIDHNSRHKLIKTIKGKGYTILADDTESKA